MSLFSKTRYLIHATNVHSGGGYSLLSALLEALPSNLEIIAQFDARMNVPESSSTKLKIRYVRVSILRRLLAELWLVKTSKPSDLILCFGNLPPLFKLRGHTVVFVQNRYLIDNRKLNAFPLRTRVRLVVERFWLCCKMGNINELVVQTPTMKSLLEIKTKGKIPIRVLPFMVNHEGYTRRMRSPVTQESKEFDFIYVASGEPHKNHRQLIEAWCVLARDGLFPSLKITVDYANFTGLSSWIDEKIKQYKLNIENVGSLPLDQVKQLYVQAGALIYPSTFESFGLPLIEARQAGLEVLASELDYVRDVIDPEQTFDPESAVSIARAVKRFIGIQEQPLPLQDAAGFIAKILERVE